MGLVREPEGINLNIQSKPLTPEEEKLSQFIKQRKHEIEKKTLRSVKVLWQPVSRLLTKVYVCCFSYKVSSIIQVHHWLTAKLER